MRPLDTVDHPPGEAMGRRRRCMCGRPFGQARLPFHVSDVDPVAPLVGPDAKPMKDLLLKTRGIQMTQLSTEAEDWTALNTTARTLFVDKSHHRRRVPVKTRRCSAARPAPMHAAGEGLR
ncbi:hypothetical protein ARTHRO9AX_180742 [Arthrobacter sp. 9AX]|nr:hypothetical protein ARTHRO9AX_180742 [Arthrobacter sp. 9AX]